MNYSGLVAASTAGKNVFRYRGKYGYVYDTETGLYYLQTRFYDPSVGRFLNEDDPDYLFASGTTLGGNLYAYCENDAVNCTDSDGRYLKISVYGTNRDRIMKILKSITDFNLGINCYNNVYIIRKNSNKHRYGNELVQSLILCSYTINICISSKGGGYYSPTNSNYGQINVGRKTLGYGTGGTVFIDFNQASTNSPIKIILAHELIHAARGVRGKIIPTKYWCYDWNCYWEEVFTVGLPYNSGKAPLQSLAYFYITENLIRLELGLKRRDRYVNFK